MQLKIACVSSQNIVPFIVTAVRTSVPASHSGFLRETFKTLINSGFHSCIVNCQPSVARHALNSGLSSVELVTEDYCLMDTTL
jgi:hypothetical protein